MGNYILPPHPSPNLTLTLNPYLGQNGGLGEGWVDNSQNLNWSSISSGPVLRSSLSEAHYLHCMWLITLPELGWTLGKVYTTVLQAVTTLVTMVRRKNLGNFSCKIAAKVNLRWLRFPLPYLDKVHVGLLISPALGHYQ